MSIDGAPCRHRMAEQVARMSVAKGGTKRHRGSRRPLTELEQRTVSLKLGQRLLRHAIRHLKGKPTWEDVPAEDRPHHTTAIMFLTVKLSDIGMELAGYKY